MVGLSSRFKAAGYLQQKFMLPLWKHTVFSYAVSSFKYYFKTQTFLFVIRKDQYSEEFIKCECTRLGIDDTKIVVLPTVTRGQAETVMEGIIRSECQIDEPITIFNIDTFRPGFRFPNFFNINEIDGYLEVFEGSGANWSYVQPDTSRPFGVSETAEKREISNLCCTGLYHFGSAKLYETAYYEYCNRDVSNLDAGELYVAPLYNALIQKGYDIRYSLIKRSDVIFCGIPSEYESLLSMSYAEDILGSFT